MRGKKARRGNRKTDFQCFTMVSGIPWDEVELSEIGEQRPWQPTLTDQCELSQEGKVLRQGGFAELDNSSMGK